MNRTVVFIEDRRAITIWNTKPAASKRRTSNVDWVGLLSERLKIDAIMNFKRLTEPQTRAEIEHSSHFGGYAEAVKAPSPRTSKGTTTAAPAKAGGPTSS